jgi:hypothetical protein
VITINQIISNTKFSYIEKVDSPIHGSKAIVFYNKGNDFKIYVSCGENNNKIELLITA